MRRVIRPSSQIRRIRTQSKAKHSARTSKAENYDRAAFYSRPQALSTPRQLVEHLNDYVIGQGDAKRVLSVSIFNHYNRIRQNRAATVPEEHSEEFYLSEVEFENGSVTTARLLPHPNRRDHLRSSIPTDPLFEKSNVLVMGPSGTGKTLLVRTLAKVLDVPFSVIDATALTQAGYVGDDADICIQRLLQASNYDPQLAARGIVYIDEIDKLARRDGNTSGEGSSRDVSGEGVQQALLKIIEGTMVTVSGKSNVVLDGVSESKGRTSGNNQYEVDTSNVLFIFSGAFVGLEKIINRRLAKGSIGFTASLKGERLEPEPRFNKYFTPSKDSLYNAYSDVEPEDLVQYGFIPEFIARMPSMTSLSPLSRSDLRQILTSVKGSLVNQYTAQFLLMGVDIKFTTGAIEAVCDQAFARGGGARGLRGIMEKLLLEPMYECPGSNIKYVLITEGTVKGSQPVGYWAKGLLREFIDAWAAEEKTDAGPLSQTSTNHTARNGSRPNSHLKLKM